MRPAGAGAGAAGRPADAMATWQLHVLWAAALLAALSVLAAGAVFAWRARSASRMRLAAQADVNGRALLGLAAALERHADWLDASGTGVSGAEQRRWARLCRRIAGEHLHCINQLLLLAPDAPRATASACVPGWIAALARRGRRGRSVDGS